MIANKKLTHVIAGRTISPPAVADGELKFTLDDGSAPAVIAAAVTVIRPIGTAAN